MQKATLLFSNTQLIYLNVMVFIEPGDYSIKIYLADAGE